MVAIAYKEELNGARPEAVAIDCSEPETNATEDVVTGKGGGLLSLETLQKPASLLQSLIALVAAVCIPIGYVWHMKEDFDLLTMKVDTQGAKIDGEILRRQKWEDRYDSDQRENRLKLEEINLRTTATDVRTQGMAGYFDDKQREAQRKH